MKDENLDISPHFNIRLYDIATLKQIDEIMAKKLYKSKNELMTACIAKALPDIYSEVTGQNRKLLEQTESALRELTIELRAQNRKVNERFKNLELDGIVMQKVINTLYAINLGALKGAVPQLSDIESGLYDTPPAYIQDYIKSAIE